ncbi:ABC-type transporter, integral membrane subunit [Tepidanaerobacter acetatoxydans Re1]|jgi:ribose transport system permease protein|uniref:ABC-type transporter, integral membrane subunit n=1 Tax=Tepidanaerobacter acetatoxydans (strain DSM 21804 / JCM 16047 / Re1) TaxID=1209989 RepID=F4LWK8_TEPAE|nr:ABC transporter permease [Tepidanaerobacter acetatoxydans]AEE90910.1 ABC-type transporter, integral membrane subunit [Tepidanaerobacter acetatoxydans Re1]CCP25488.1 ABC-type transporter, integral membrane subunit [Tepidanaerobacter acetatoxydans Re1]
MLKTIKNMSNKTKYPKDLYKMLITEYSFILSFILLVIIAASVNKNFFTWTNISNIFVQSSMVGLIAMGMSMVISAGLIDISVGSQVAFIGSFGILVLNNTGSIFIMLLFCIVVGFILGGLNGLMVTKGGIPAMIATMAMQSACRSIINHFGSGGPFTVNKEYYESLRMLAVGGIYITPKFKIPYLMIIFCAAGIIFDIIMKHTKFGKYIYAVGSNETSARLSGINVDLVKACTFIVTGIMCGITSLIYASRTTAVAAASAATGFEMDAIAAVAIGGTSMSGGKGKIIGTFIGVLMFKMISNILTAADVSTYLNGAISAAIIVIAVLMQKLQNSKKSS